MTLGLLRKYKELLLYATAGIGHFRGVIRHDDYSNKFNSWGGKVRLGILFAGEYVSLGITPYYDFSSEMSYAGLTANLAFGRFIKDN